MTCQFCDSNSFGPGCIFSSVNSRTGKPRIHVHLNSTGCIYCDSRSVGRGCPFSPNGLHQRGVGNNQLTIQNDNSEDDNEFYQDELIQQTYEEEHIKHDPYQMFLESKKKEEVVKTMKKAFKEHEQYEKQWGKPFNIICPYCQFEFSAYNENNIFSTGLPCIDCDTLLIISNDGIVSEKKIN